MDRYDIEPLALAAMANQTYPKPLAEVIATLVELCRHQERGELVEICTQANARFEETNYDNWNGGTTTWSINLEVPIPIYAAIESRLEAVEKELLAKISYLDRLCPNDPIGGVTITPSAVSSPGKTPPEIEVRRIWDEEKLRLFLSHLAKHKVAVSKLKTELSVRGVSAFVAHEDIEPSLQWMSEIELGLRSMQALAALLTPEFHESKYTDQEIGWALGRGIQVFPVRLGIDPYGFAGQYQGVTGKLDEPELLADAIVTVLLKNAQTRREMRRALIKAFTAVNSYARARSVQKLLDGLSDFTAEEKLTLWGACKDNNQITDAYGVAPALYRKIGTPPVPKVEEDVPF